MSTISNISETMEYEVRRSRRKSMAIHIHRDRRVVVRAPLRCLERDIRLFVDRHKNWISRKLAEYTIYPGLPESQYRQGGFVWLLGKKLAIEVRQGNRQRVIHEPEKLCVYQRQTEDEITTARLVSGWKRDFAMSLYQTRLKQWFEQFPVQLPDYQLKLRKMKRQWGNCHSNGTITINTRLIRYPESCIDYVLIHELTHLKYMHHGQSFYRLLERVMPDWQQHRLLLSRYSGDPGVDA